MADSMRLQVLKAVFNGCKTALGNPTFYKRRYLRQLQPSDVATAGCFSVYMEQDALASADAETNGAGVQERIATVVIEGRYSGEPAEDVCDADITKLEKAFVADLTWGGVAQHSSWEIHYSAEEDSEVSWAGFRMVFQILYLNNLLT